MSECLREKSAHAREPGALVLSLLNTPNAIKVLEPLIETEKTMTFEISH
ncbi:hypothetical protein [Leptospira borgpetersenii]|nr:hypothetical protein [Leptospira borgpetersenii]MBE8426236.1 hypothetical protein [Leptospira borgpetersenii serovar Tarassovi]MBF3378091.1 hypothetical protein [Leptospira borgpetersenii serovar Balcanica]